jgi:hypothetical protein
MIISVDAQKAFNKSQHPFMIRAQKKLEIEGIYLDTMKGYIRETYSQYCTKWGESKTIPSEVSNDMSVHSLHFYLIKC